MKDKVKKNKVDWCSILYNLHISDVWNGYHLYMKVSRNRSAYYLLKKYYSTTAIRKAAYLFRTEGLTSAVNYLQWFDEYRKQKNELLSSSNCC